MDRRYILLLGAVSAAILAAPSHAAKNPSQERLLKLSGTDRAKLFTTFLAERREPCPGGVIRTFLQGMDQKKNAYWDVACQNNVMYSISVGADAAGTTKVIECRVQQKLSGVPCFVSFADLKKRQSR
jgi:hypothetical protein